MMLFAKAPNISVSTGTLFRYADGPYIFNLSTQRFLTGRYRISVIPDDAEERFIVIGLR